MHAVADSVLAYATGDLMLDQRDPRDPRTTRTTIVVVPNWAATLPR